MFQAIRWLDELCKAAASGEVHGDGIGDVRMSVEERGHYPPVRCTGAGLYRPDDPISYDDIYILFGQVFAEERPAGDDMLSGLHLHPVYMWGVSIF